MNRLLVILSVFIGTIVIGCSDRSSDCSCSLYYTPWSGAHGESEEFVGTYPMNDYDGDCSQISFSQFVKEYPDGQFYSNHKGRVRCH